MNRTSVEKARIARRAAIDQLHAEGLTNTQIAMRMGERESTVAIHIRRLGLTPNAPAQRSSGIRLDRAPWEAHGPDPRHETAPRGRTHMVGEKWEPESLDCSGIVAAIRAEHRRATA